MANIRISSCVSKLTNKSVIMVIDALIKGETNPDNLMKLVYGNTKTNKVVITGSLDRIYKGSSSQSFKMGKEIYDNLERQTQNV